MVVQAIKLFEGNKLAETVSAISQTLLLMNNSLRAKTFSQQNQSTLCWFLGGDLDSLPDYGFDYTNFYHSSNPSFSNPSLSKALFLLDSLLKNFSQKEKSRLLIQRMVIVDVFNVEISNVCNFEF